MEENFLQLLKRGKHLTPRTEFTKRSHELIVTAPQKPKTFFSTFRIEIKENLTFGLSLSLASILLLVIFGGFYWGFPGENGGAPNQEVVLEAQSIDFEIHLHEAKYFSESAEEVAAILDEINTPLE